MPDTIDPTLAAAVGRDCLATYRAGGSAVDATGTTRPDEVVGRASGRLGLILDADDCPTGIAIETDGAVSMIELGALISLAVCE